MHAEKKSALICAFRAPPFLFLADYADIRRKIICANPRYLRDTFFSPADYADARRKEICAIHGIPFLFPADYADIRRKEIRANPRYPRDTFSYFPQITLIPAEKYSKL